MPLPSFFQKKDKAPKRAAVAEDAGPVQEARVRARRRLIGAVVLLAAGIVGFPMLFETKPRPMPVDVPIDLARKDNAAPRPARVQPPPAVVELPADAGNETPAVPPPSFPASGVPAAAPVKVADASSKPAAASAIKAPVPTPRPSAPIPRNDESVRNDKPSAEARPATPASAEAPAGRFVVQVGAYTDQGALREARQKVEKLGLKTYTQDVDTPSGKRTRLRVGPFATRDQAESAGARLKAIGLPGNLLVL
jgi:DedD protein